MLAKEHPQQFAPLYGRLVSFELNANVKSEKETKVIYPITGL